MTHRSRSLLAALGLGAALVALSGCGIRPTAVPVDAGAPASRTACPSPLHVPEAVVTPAPQRSAPTVLPFGTARPSPSKSPESVFSASPSPSHCP
ncbi:hypothetical protein [Kitasatospora sp. McL0602]|uniref:hypothetical protein n=1 Tax=Kitasatospora sp. McL0602 TaxID=3439530 RepID=UPI003F8BED87